MKSILRPGMALMNRLTMLQKLAFLSVLFSAPLAVFYVDAGASLSASAYLWAAGLLGFALYCTVAFYVQSDATWVGLIGAIRRIGEGDLTARINTRAAGHFGAVMSVLGDMGTSLSGIVSQVRSSSHAISVSAREIAAGNSSLSQRTEQQASTLEETASGMEELASTVEQNAANCKIASELSQDAARVAQKGSQAVHAVVASMARIDESSKRVADIITVIEGIAFQTNILALNAAIEAARAGAQGRGFAVVASEVRALAHRSAEAAKEIKALIERSVDQVANGGVQAAAAGEVIDEIVTSVKKTDQVIGQIAVASAEQSAGLGEINKAILQLENVTQQNATLVEQAAASSLTYQEQAEHLSGIVARFQVLDEATTPEWQAKPEPQALRPLPKRIAEAAFPGREWKQF